jgi:glycosyltransferase involved in cell wall biosynthesis
MNALDVCLNPQLLNEITLGNYPRKVDEYLAMGKPVVATKTGTMELFRGYAHLCTNAAEYVRAIDQALGENDADTVSGRIRFARSHSWENNVEAIYQHLNTLM